MLTKIAEITLIKLAMDPEVKQAFRENIERPMVGISCTISTKNKMQTLANTKRKRKQC